MNGNDYARLDTAVDRLSSKLSARFDSIDTKLDGHGNRLTGIETLMGERCVKHAERIDELEKSERTASKVLAKHAVIIGLALSALAGLVMLSLKALG